MLNSLTGDSFESWVLTKVTEHQVEKQQEDCLELDPAIAEAYRNSTAASGKLLLSILVMY